MKMRNNVVSKKTARSVLQVLFSPADIKNFEFLRAVLLCGLPGSGKSTVGQLLHTLYGFERFSSDQIRTEELFKGQEHRLGKEHERVMASRYLVYEELARRVGRALALGKRVVVDGTNLDDKRLMVVGATLAQVPVEQVAYVVFKPPEWVMRRRFLEGHGTQEAKNWWSIYKYWRKYMKDGKAAFPTDAAFPRIKKIMVKRYSIRTFEWVPQIKGILWDVDGTLYKDTPRLRQAFDKPCIDIFVKTVKLSRRQGEKKFWDTYKKLGSKTKTLESVGINGKQFIEKLSETFPYEKLLKRDRKITRLIQALPHVRHFIFSNSSMTATQRKLSALGIAPQLFDKVLVSYESPYLKPDPRAFTWAAKQTGLGVGQLLAVGDREETDIGAAKTAGMRTVYVWGTSKEADVSLPTVYEVAELFGKEL